MPSVAFQHVRKHRASNEHRSYRIDAHCFDDLLRSLLVECLVACYDACAVYEYVDLAAVFDSLPIRDVYNLIVRYVHHITFDFAIFAEFLAGRFDADKVDVPYDEAFSSFFQSHAAHDLADSGSSSGNQHVCVLKFHNHFSIFAATKIFQ